MLYPWLVILPPILVVICALFTRNIIASFLVGILSATLLVASGNLLSALSISFMRFLESTGLTRLHSWPEFMGNWNLFIFLFLMVLGILIALLQKIGASAIFAHVMRKYVKSKRGAQKASLILSLFFFIDDYFSVLTVGSVMRGLASRYNLHPVKLAFLVTAVATPITILSPISSWIGEIVGQFKLVGISTAGSINTDSYYVFLKVIPFIFYAFLMIIGAWYIVLRGISYGPMAMYDHATVPHENPTAQHAGTDVRFIDFLVPVGSLIIFILAGFLYSGNSMLFGGTHGFINAIKNTVPHQALLGGGLLSLIMSFVYFIARKKITFWQMMRVIKEGIALMLPSIIMLICAWTFGSILRQDLHTGDYIASLFLLFMSVTFLPLVCFIFSAVMSCMIGSAWATIGIMLPIVVPMLQSLAHVPHVIGAEAIPLLYPILGATLSGAIMGTNVSFISDNPIMTCASTGANHYEHIKTMTWYVIPVALATAGAYMILGLGSSFFTNPQIFLISLLSALLVMLGLFELFQRVFKK